MTLSSALAEVVSPAGFAPRCKSDLAQTMGLATPSAMQSSEVGQRTDNVAQGKKVVGGARATACGERFVRQDAAQLGGPVSLEGSKRRVPSADTADCVFGGSPS